MLGQFSDHAIVVERRASGGFRVCFYAQTHSIEEQADDPAAIVIDYPRPQSADIEQP